jgi:hypothetical protein
MKDFNEIVEQIKLLEYATNSSLIQLIMEQRETNKLLTLLLEEFTNFNDAKSPIQLVGYNEDLEEVD